MEFGPHARVDDISKRTILSRLRQLRPGVTSSVQKIASLRSVPKSSFVENTLIVTRVIQLQELKLYDVIEAFSDG